MLVVALEDFGTSQILESSYSSWNCTRCHFISQMCFAPKSRCFHSLLPTLEALPYGAHFSRADGQNPTLGQSTRGPYKLWLVF